MATNTSMNGLNPLAITRVPDETWDDIFLWSMSGRPFPVDITKTNDGPWALGQVCRGWRRIVTSRSRLWTDFRLEARSDGAPGTQGRAYIFLLESVLKRSGGFPLRFFITVGDTAVGEPLIPLLLKELKRWKTACIVAPRYTFAHLPIQHAILVASGHDDTAQALESVTLTASEVPEVGWTCTLEMLRAAPKLHSASLVGLFSNDLPWVQLASVEMGKLRFPDLISVLNKCPELRRLCLPDAVGYLHSEGARSGMEEQPLSIVTLQALESLDIYDVALLPHLRASPTELKVSDWLIVDPDKDLNEFQILNDFLMASPAVQAFTITTPYLDLFRLEDFWPLMPQLEELQITIMCGEGGGQGDDLLKQLERVENDGCQVPMLRELVVIVDGEVEFSAEALIHFLSFRRFRGLGPQGVRLHRCTFFEASNQDLQMLGAMMEEDIVALEITSFDGSDLLLVDLLAGDPEGEGSVLV